MTLRSVLIILALVCFFLAGVGAVTPRGNLTAAGLFFLSFALLVT